MRHLRRIIQGFKGVLTTMPQICYTIGIKRSQEGEITMDTKFILESVINVVTSSDIVDGVDHFLERYGTTIPDGAAAFLCLVRVALKDDEVSSIMSKDSFKHWRHAWAEWVEVQRNAHKLSEDMEEVYGWTDGKRIAVINAAKQAGRTPRSLI